MTGTGAVKAAICTKIAPAFGLIYCTVASDVKTELFKVIGVLDPPAIILMHFSITCIQLGVTVDDVKRHDSSKDL